jgi:hypothetical protein
MDLKKNAIFLATTIGKMSLSMLLGGPVPHNQLGDSDSRAGATRCRKDRMFVSRSHFPHVLCGCSSVLT